MFSYISPITRKHYESFEDRFAKLIFNKIYKNEFFEYVNWLIEKLNIQHTINHDCVPDDFNITFRTLTQYVTLNGFNTQKICKEIATYVKPKTEIYGEFRQIQ